MAQAELLSDNELMSEIQLLEFLLVVRRSFIQPAIYLSRLAKSGQHVPLAKSRELWYSSRLAEYVETRDKLHAVNAEFQRRISLDRTT